MSGDPSKESKLGQVRLVHASAVIVVGSRQLAPPGNRGGDGMADVVVAAWRQAASTQGPWNR